LHRYLALHLWAQGKEVLSQFADLMRNRVEPIYVNDVELAAALADGGADVSARDLIHIAVMTRIEATQIVSADKGFDRIPGVQRLDPAAVDSWQQLVAG
jgi:predicted nucleic acid-binding protein